MPNYDFKNLSSFDFECLSRDLLQKKLGIFLETFKQGKDGGIDLRHTTSNNGTFIIQCKHYADSPFRTLARHLQSSERPKIVRLHPSRYILTTSTPLSPANKAKLLSILTPYCKTPEDILGRDDLNNLLTQYPEIEKAHFKLWLTSHTTLEKILNSQIYNESEIEKERIKNRLKRYVQNESYFDALDTLERHHSCIICGIPGIGKTTLAELIIITLIERGYEPIKITDSISAAFSSYQANKKQAFFYDDFLGQSSLEVNLEKNEDDRLIRFMEHLASSKNHRLIMTTREYILAQARQRYEKLNNRKFDVQRCTISLDSYTNKNKATILFNHLYFSPVPQTHREALVRSGVHKQIISHRNYTPRIIEWMTDHLATTNLTADEYGKEFLANLDVPNRLWDHAYKRQISTAAQALVLLVGTTSGEISLDDLKLLFESLRGIQSERYNWSRRPREFEDALQEVDGNFVATNQFSDGILVKLHNPSIRDFIQHLREASEEIIHDILSSAVFFDQLRELLRLKDIESPSEIFLTKIRLASNLLVRALEQCWDKPDCERAETGHYGSHARNRRAPFTIESRLLDLFRIAELVNSENIQTFTLEKCQIVISSWGTRYALAVDVLRIIKKVLDINAAPSELKDLALRNGKNSVFEEPMSINDFDACVDFIKNFPELITTADREHLRQSLSEQSNQDHGYYFWEEIDDPDQIKAKKKLLKRIATALDADVAEALNSAQARIRELNSAEELEYDDWEEKGLRHQDDRDADDYVESLFTSLLDNPESSLDEEEKDDDE